MSLPLLILGYGEMGHAMEYLLAPRHDVKIWSRSLNTNLELEVFKARVILFCLPVNAHRQVLHQIAPYLAGGSLCLSIAKGLDESGMTAAQIFATVLSDKYRYGVIYGPMISEEIRLGRYAFADVALTVANDFKTIRNLFGESRLICRQVTDMSGSSWSVILKNVYAILFGISDELGLGDNMRGYLVVAAVTEISSILTSIGAEKLSPFSFAGLGDLLATATSENSHHHALGRNLVKGHFDEISGEGVHTIKMIEKLHLFDHQNFPLFKLVRDIISQPDSLRTLVERHLKNLQTW